MKKFLSMVLALIMVLSMFTVSAGAAFEDADEIQYTAAVDVMTKLGILSGYDNNYFSPNGTISRGAAAKILAYIALGTKKAEALTCVEAPFSDVAITSSVAPFITWVAKEGIVTGYDNGTFAPKAAVSGHAYLKMVLGAMGIEGTFEGDGWRLNVTNAAAEAGLFAGVDTTAYDLRAAMTRELACQIAFNAMFYSKTATKTQYIVWVDVAGGTTDEYDEDDKLIYKGTDAMAAAVAQLGTTNAQMIQDTVAADSLGYKNFGLKKAENGTTTFERPSVNYTSDIASYAKTLKTVSEAKTPVLTYTNGVKLKTIWTDLGYTKATEKIDLFVSVDGATRDTETPTYADVSKNASTSTAVGGVGSTVEVYATETADEYYVVVINNWVKKLAADDIVKAVEATSTTDAVPAYIIAAIGAENDPDEDDFVEYGDNGSFKTDAFAKNDIIIYTTDAGVIKSVTKATKVAGVTVDKYTSTAVTVAGVALPVAAKVESVVADYDFDKTYDLWLDAQGNIVRSAATSAATVKNYAYIVAYKANAASTGILTASTENYVMAEAIFADGTHKAIELNIIETEQDNGTIAYSYMQPNGTAAAGKTAAQVTEQTLTSTVDGSGNVITVPVNNWVTYTLNADGTYTLGAINESYAKVVANGTIDMDKDVPEQIGGKYTTGKTTLTVVAASDDAVATATGMIDVTLDAGTNANQVLYTFASSTATTITGIYAVEQDDNIIDTDVVGKDYVYAVKAGAKVKGGTEWTFAVGGKTVVYTVSNSVTAGEIYTLTFNTKGIATADVVEAYGVEAVGVIEDREVALVDDTYLFLTGDGSPVYLTKDTVVTNIEKTSAVVADTIEAEDVVTLVIKNISGKDTVLAAFIKDAK